MRRFLILNRPNPTRDRVLSTFVLNSHLHVSEKCLKPNPPKGTHQYNDLNACNGNEYGGYNDNNNNNYNTNGNNATSDMHEEESLENETVEQLLRKSRGKVLTMDDWIDRMSSKNPEISEEQYPGIIASCNSMLEKTWSIPKLQAYVSWIQDTCVPDIGIQAANIIQKYYLYQRKSDDQNASR